MRAPCGLTAMGCVCSCSSGVKCSVFSVQAQKGVWSPALACMLCHPKERDDGPGEPGKGGVGERDRRSPIWKGGSFLLLLSIHDHVKR